MIKFQHLEVTVLKIACKGTKKMGRSQENKYNILEQEENKCGFITKYRRCSLKIIS